MHNTQRLCFFHKKKNERKKERNKQETYEGLGRTQKHNTFFGYITSILHIERFLCKYVLDNEILCNKYFKMKVYNLEKSR